LKINGGSLECPCEVLEFYFMTTVGTLAVAEQAEVEAIRKRAAVVCTCIAQAMT